MVDVDDATGVPGAEIGWKDLHEPGQDHHVPSRRVEQCRHRAEGLALGAGIEGDMAELDAVPLHQ